MSRNDKILFLVFALTLSAIVLVAFAPSSPDNNLIVKIWAIADSNISIAVVSTFIAAFAGTFGAQQIVERSAKRDRLLVEIRGANVALNFGYGIMNTYILIKEQHVRKMCSNYQKQVSDLAALQERDSSGQRLALFEYQVDLKTLSPPFSPLDALQKVMLEKFSPSPQSLRLLTPLMQSINGLTNVMRSRNEWIEEYKLLPDGSPDKHDFYFGLVSAEGHADERYPHYIEGIEKLTDDCIAFSMMLCKALDEYGESVCLKYGRGAPKLSKVDWDKAKKEGLLPDMSKYPDWSEQ